MSDYSQMSSAEIADHIYADAPSWEWSVDEHGNEVPPKFGYDERYIKRASQEDEDELNELLGKVYRRQLTESKPLDSEMQQVLSDNIIDLL